MRIKIWILGLILSLSAMVSAQQPHPILTSFEAYKQTNGVLLRWVISGGNQCQGTKVYRSVDAIEFEQINHIPGICGGNQADETYTYFDTIPFANSNNHYRLEMGFQGFTEVVTVFFEDFGSKNFLIYSDHASDRFTILFSNDLNAKTTLEIFDRVGNTVYRDVGTGNNHTFQSLGWRPGVYFFRISGVSEADLVGKIYIGR